jgi:hypothetical protein
VVLGDDDHLVQLVNMSADEAREFALAGHPRAPERRPDFAAVPAASVTQMRDDVGPDLVTVPPASPDAGPAAAPLAPVRQLHAAPRYLTQAEVADQLGMNVAAFVKWRQRARQAGAPLPEPVYFAGRPGWTDDQLEQMAARRDRSAS